MTDAAAQALAEANEAAYELLAGMQEWADEEGVDCGTGDRMDPETIRKAAAWLEGFLPMTDRQSLVAFRAAAIRVFGPEEL